MSQGVGISRAYSALGPTLLLWTRLAYPQVATVESELGEDAESTQNELTQERSVPSNAVEKPVPLHITSPKLDEVPSHEVEVVVELTIDQQGTIVASSLVSGEEPFASAALNETPNWTFHPARRDNKPIESKIYFLVTFSPPAAPVAETIDPQAEPEPVT